MEHWRQKLNVLAKELREMLWKNRKSLSDEDELWIRSWATEIDGIAQDRNGHTDSEYTIPGYSAFDLSKILNLRSNLIAGWFQTEQIPNKIHEKSRIRYATREDIIEFLKRKEIDIPDYFIEIPSTQPVKESSDE